MGGVVAAAQGKLTLARSLYGQARDGVVRVGMGQTAGDILMGEAGLEVTVGNAALAARKASEALAMGRSRERLADAAVVLALAGDPARASALIDEAARQVPPTATLFHSVSAPAARASIELARNAPEKAVEALQPAAPYMRAKFGLSYLRGNAYLAMARPTEATADFRRILDNYGFNPVEVFCPLAHLGLARAAAMAGDAAAARRSYEEFFTRWKDADTDVPVLLQAQAEYRRLGR
jgi:tetratricopeptide (TPR) repeat protein